MRLSKRVKVLVGIGTAWVVLYPFLFVFLSMLSMFLGVGLASMRGSGILVGFYALVPLHLLTIILWPVLVGFYLVYITRNNMKVEVGRVILGLGLFFLPFIVMPLCYYLYVWRAQPPTVQPIYHEANAVQQIETVGQGAVTEFRPSLGRFVASCTVLFAALLAVTIPCYSLELGGIDSPAFIIKFFALIVGGAALSLVIYGLIQPRLAITITNRQVYSSGSLLRRRVMALPIQEVDVIKSRKHATVQSFTDNYYIESISNQRIGVSQFIYSKKQFQQMLDAIESMRATGATS